MSDRSAEKPQPDWDGLAREAPWSRDEWIAAARYLGDLPQWRELWPLVVRLSRQTGVTPYSAAMQVRQAIVIPPTGGERP